MAGIAPEAETAPEPFLTLPIRMPPLPSFPYPALHEVRLRRHTPKTPSDTDRRALFLKNVPIDGTEAHLRALFASLVGPGRFEAAFFEGPASRRLPVVDPARLTRVEGLAAGRKRKRTGGRAANEVLNEEEDEAAKRKREAEAATLPDLWDRRIHRSGSSAVVLVADEGSVRLVLRAVAKLGRTKRYPTWDLPADTGPLGAARIAEHLRRSHSAFGSTAAEATQSAVRALFAIYNRREREAAELARRLRGEPDEDGFVTVTRHGGGRVAPASRADAEHARRRMLERAGRRTEATTGLYGFQLRERRKREQEEMLGRFEQDREHVRAMRVRRQQQRATITKATITSGV